ncbi:tetratricopeptide repeat protein [Schlesneria sp.]|uniref:tetratricopeptide repeat protein n=1 Tax=Schlesneria sp. TaxID=2762018 RepID=UPI002EDE9C23
MSDADPNPGDAAAPVVAGKKKRSVLERILVWGGILALLSIVLVEWSSKKFYGEALQNLEKKLQVRNAGGLQIGLPLAEAKNYVRGFTFQSERGKRPRRRLTYAWPSLFKTFKIAMIVDDDDQVVSVDSHDEFDDGPVRPNSLGAETEARFYLKSPKVKTDEQVLELARQEKPLSDHFGTRYGSLIRELVRQSFLITARCEMGLTTRDSAFGEVLLLENAEPRFPLQVVVQMEYRHEPPNPVCRIDVSRVQPDGKNYSWTKSLEIHGQDLENFVTRLEILSRGEFIQVLQDAGFIRLTPPKWESALAESGVEPSLDVVSQFSELRRLSAELTTHGESYALLERLVRVYANLGSVTDFYWSSTSKSFKARSLLYADRYFAKQGVTVRSLAHRAYARALAGRHSAALADVSAAMKLENETKPAWLELIDAYCSYKPDVLRRTKGDCKELSLYLLMRVLQHSGSSKQFTAAIDRFLDANPASLRACRSLCETGELGSYRAATESRFDMAWNQVYQRLGAISDLPNEAREVVDAQVKVNGLNPDREHSSRIALFQALRNSGAQASDKSEPSWSMLAELLEEATFVQVTDVLYCQKSMLGVSAERSLTELRPLVATHRMKGFIESFTVDPQRSTITLSNFTRMLNTQDYEPQMEIFLSFYHRFADNAAYSYFFQRIFANSDLLFNDLQIESKYQSPPHDQRAQIWRGISPYHPASVAFSIRHDWSSIKGIAPDWEDTYSKCPNVMIALGQKYRSLGRSEEAIRCLKKSIETAPSYEAYLELADEYYVQGDLVAYQETLEDSLDTPDFGLEKANVQQRLAYFLMKKGRWEEAQPFAAEAAATYSGWGLNTAARCAEGLKAWRTAEDMHRRISERYSGSQTDWYFWCVRTGRGNIDSARAVADTYWQTFVPPYATYQKDTLFYRHLIDAENENALEIIRTLKVEPLNAVDTIDLDLDPRWVLHGAVLADELKDSALRDKLLNCLPILCARHSTQVVHLANLFARALKDPDNFQWDAVTFDEMMTRAFYDEVTFLYFVAGRFLEIHAQEELARRYLLTAATSFQVDKRSCMLASLMLRSQNIPVGESRLSELPDDLEAFSVLITKARNLRGKRALEEAEKYLEEAAALGLSPSTVLVEKSLLAEARKQYPEAIQYLEAAIQANPNSVDVRSRLAWLLATCRDDKVRNGAAALSQAQAAYELEQFKSYPTLIALAAAYAETGQFKLAAEQERLAVQLVSDYPERYDRLQLYLHEKPFRYPPLQESTDSTENVKSQ